MDKPTLFVTNWSSQKLHGPGRKLGIMAAPRRWEHGDGRVTSCAPEIADLRAIQDWLRDCLAPGVLSFVDRDGFAPVSDGDTMLCSCSKDAAARGECHRVWVAAALVRAGWRVVLDGITHDAYPEVT